MMLLTDTKLICAGGDTASVGAMATRLTTAGLSVSTKEQWYPASSDAHGPVIWLLVYSSVEALLASDYPSFHGNRESFIFLLSDLSGGTDSRIKFPLLSVDMPLNGLIQSLLIEEQQILQRNLFQSPLITDQVFERLHFYGRSPAYVAAITTIEQYAETDASVLIKGETGAGKELTARSIHYLSSRSDGPFIPVNCGAFSDELILSELFGYEKGAFTGATKTKQGLLEAADGGTVFLDEVDSLSPKAQVTLLRYLQNNEIRPVGSNKVKIIDVRVVAATNQNLRTLVSNQDFREDLMYRLDLLSLTLPPLRERGEDIQLLAQYFLAELSAEYDHHHKVFDLAMINEIREYQWPGNVRELENFIKRAYLLSKTRLIDNPVWLTGQSDSGQKAGAARLDKPELFHDSFRVEKQNLINQFEKDYLRYVLNQARGNISKAANIAQKERRSFCRLMEKHGLSRDQYAS